MSEKNKTAEKGWEVYIIQTESGKLYTGISNDLEKRFEKHVSGKGAKFFRSEKPSHIVFREVQSNRSLASRRETEIKKMSRKEKLQLLKLYSPS